MLSFSLMLSSTLLSSGSGCGSVGRAIAFNIKGPRFDSIY